MQCTGKEVDIVSRRMISKYEKERCTENNFLKEAKCSEKDFESTFFACNLMKFLDRTMKTDSLTSEPDVASHLVNPSPGFTELGAAVPPQKPPESTPTYTCPTCGKTFFHKSSLKDYNKSHLKHLKTCQTCEKTWLNEFRLMNHMKIHSEKPEEDDDDCEIMDIPATPVTFIDISEDIVIPNNFDSDDYSTIVQEFESEDLEERSLPSTNAKNPHGATNYATLRKDTENDSDSNSPSEGESVFCSDSNSLKRGFRKRGSSSNSEGNPLEEASSSSGPSGADPRERIFSSMHDDDARSASPSPYEQKDLTFAFSFHKEFCPLPVRSRDTSAFLPLENKVDNSKTSEKGMNRRSGKDTSPSRTGSSKTGSYRSGTKRSRSTTKGTHRSKTRSHNRGLHTRSPVKKLKRSRSRDCHSEKDRRHHLSGRSRSKDSNRSHIRDSKRRSRSRSKDRRKSRDRDSRRGRSLNYFNRHHRSHYRSSSRDRYRKKHHSRSRSRSRDHSKGRSGGAMVPQMALQQTMVAMSTKAQAHTGIALPKHYNPAAVNSLKYAAQGQKTKLLRQTKEKGEKSEEVIDDRQVMNIPASRTPLQGISEAIITPKNSDSSVRSTTNHESKSEDFEDIPGVASHMVAPSSEFTQFCAVLPQKRPKHTPTHPDVASNLVDSPPEFNELSAVPPQKHQKPTSTHPDVASNLVAPSPGITELSVVPPQKRPEHTPTYPDVTSHMVNTSPGCNKRRRIPHHKQSKSAPTHACQTCGKMFLLKNSLQQHMKIYSKICQMCGNHFFRNIDLTEHVKIHLEKPEEGDDCQILDIPATPKPFIDISEDIVTPNNADSAVRSPIIQEFESEDFEKRKSEENIDDRQVMDIPASHIPLQGISEAIVALNNLDSAVRSTRNHISNLEKLEETKSEEDIDDRLIMHIPDSHIPLQILEAIVTPNNSDSAVRSITNQELTSNDFEKTISEDCIDDCQVMDVPASHTSSHGISEAIVTPNNSDSSVSLTNQESKSKNFEETVKISKDVTERCTQTDEFSTYSQYVDNKLKNYSDRTRAIVEVFISNVLHRADVGEFDKPPFVSGQADTKFV